MTKKTMPMPIQTPIQMPMAGPIGVLIIGYGLSGRIFHGALLQSMPEHYCVRGVVTSNAQKAEEAILDHPGVVVYSQEAMDMALEREDIQLVIVSTPNDTHEALALQALSAGKHVLLEKPFVPTAEQGKRVIAAARAAGRLVSVYQNRRFDGDFLTVQQMIESGILGRLVAMESRFDRFRPVAKSGAWREAAVPGAGILYDLGAHLVDQAAVLFGQPSRIYADVRRQRGDQAAVDDGFELILDYPEGSKGYGVKVSLMSGSFVNYPTPRFVLMGDKGSYVQFGLDPQEGDLRGGLRPHVVEASGQDWGARNPDEYGIFYSAEGEKKVIPTVHGDYRLFFKALYEAILSGDEGLLPVRAEEALRTIELIELAQAQAKA